jgi:RNA polymerase sigma-70 factor (ECF subfamily)
MTDGELVRQTLAGQTQAYEELVRRWAGRVMAVCHGRVGRAGVAEDMAQETLLRGFRALPTLADPDKFGSWLCGIATRACLDWLKAKERSQVSFSVLSPDRGAETFPDHQSETCGDALDRQDETRLLMEEVEALPPEYREVVMLYYYEDVTYRDLARMLDVSPATINARLTKARARLRERLGDKVRR